MTLRVVRTLAAAGVGTAVSAADAATAPVRTW
jgi:hypothetical protein